MTMKVGSDVFVDANLLVYAMFDYLPWHAEARDRLAELERERVTLWSSRQVLREFLAVSTRPGVLTSLPPALFLAQLIAGFEARFKIAEDRYQVTALLLELLHKPGARGRQVHDANIVATMRHHGIQNLLTHNTSDFARYQPWITVLPLIV